MKVEPPKTIAEFEKVLETIHELMGNPYCDHLMFMDLVEREKEAEAKILRAIGATLG